ncbi:MAG: glutamine-hydrolyzing carbamoyl-phosphate synthase small subunit [Candidatus Diapherotrites archaeon]|nr:glutamine-hydrolyzing carbamoyl-phosphate synthase small subunit [Candidatus Diapherotrites archaeon]
MPEQVNAKLVLEDGTVFEGVSFGAEKSIAGEVVFNTGMVGYPESFTDPSYNGQILALAYPLIGNYGVPGKEKDKFGLLKNFESEKAQITGLIVADYSSQFSHWQAEQSLAGWLQKEGIPAITGIDCRALTKKLREKGVMLGKIVFNEEKLDFVDPNKRNLAAEVSCKEPQLYENGKQAIALIDCGAKNNIVRSLLQRNVSVLRVPWDYDLFNGKYDFDAILVSNGPGNPKTMAATIETVKKSLEYGLPTFGICFGNQILALAAGADTYKLKYGHRSQNQPCQIVGTKKCFITSQNHGFAVDEKTLPSDWLPWFKNLNDGTNEGIRHKSNPFMSIQFHPEASPGPVDTAFLFDEFLKIVESKKK